MSSDFDAFANPIVGGEPDPLFGRPVPHHMLRSKFSDERTYRLFVGRIHKRWLRWVVKSEMNDSEKILVSRSLYATLGDEP
jgi:hypothetical protein